MTITTVETMIRFIAQPVGAISGTIMLGNRFSLTASAFVFASACSAILSSSTSAQQYQQTSYPQYSNTVMPGLSTQATNGPVFSGTQNDATAMSPDTWGESAIKNPYVGYQPRATFVPAQAVQSSGDYSVYAPGWTDKVVSKLATAAKDAADSGELKSIMEPLTNTEYSRTEKAAYPENRYAQLLDVPGLPNLKQAPSFPFTRSNNSGTSLNVTPPVPKQITSLPAVPAVTPSFAPSTVAPPLAAPSATPVTQRGFSLGASPQIQSPAAPQTFAPVQPSGPINSGPINSAPINSAPINIAPISDQFGFNQSVSGFPSQTFVQTPFQTHSSGYQGWGLPSNVNHRSVNPTVRNNSILDSGELFDNENKKRQFPPFREIIATGRFFGSADVAFLRPHFLGNTAVSIDGPEFSESIPFDFDNETAPHLRFGFESKYGPGFEFNYFTINANSEVISETFNGIAPINTIASITGPNRFTQLSADGIGDILNVNHSFELETFGVNVFKEIQFKVSRINGQFGFTYANIAQSLEATVNDGAGNVLDSLDSTSDFRGFGPRFGIEYYRPVGHTPFEFITSFHGTGLFGRRDQFVENSTELVQRRFGADEFVTVFDFLSGLQYKKTTGENRSWFARVAFVHQSWFGGGTAVDPQGDFGLKGFTFGVGYNR